jgi:hypothetical protein
MVPIPTVQHPRSPEVMMNRIAGEANMETILIFSAVLAMLVGLGGVIEGNLHCFGIMRRKKNQPW